MFHQTKQSKLKAVMINVYMETCHIYHVSSILQGVSIEYQGIGFEECGMRAAFDASSPCLSSKFV